MSNTTVQSADKMRDASDLVRLSNLVNALPAYVEVAVSGVFRGEQEDIVLLTRDCAVSDRFATRRLTSLSYGVEVMDFYAYLDGCRNLFDDGKFLVSINFEASMS